MRKKNRQVYAILALLLTVTIIFTGCGTASSVGNISKQDVNASDITQETESFFAMDTYMTITAYGKSDNAKNAVSRAREEIERLDSILSTGRQDSEIGALNEAGYGSVSYDTDYLIKKAMQIYDSTDGVFDISIYPVMQLWGFTDDNYKVPDNESLKEALLKVNEDNIIISEEKATDNKTEKDNASLGNSDEAVAYVTLKDGTKIDLGGIAKGYASSKAMDIFRECGIESGIVNLGGNVQVLGTKTDAGNWRIAIENPAKDGTYLGVIEANDKAIITSGGYERYFIENGIRYHHIINPKNGMPADNGLTSVTIISDDGTLADALSTSLFIMGEENAIDYWRTSGQEFDFILYTQDNNLIISSGIKDSFTSDNNIQVVYK